MNATVKHSPAFLKLVESVMPRIREVSVAEVSALSRRGGDSRGAGVMAQSEQAGPHPNPAGEGIIIDVREESEFAAGHIPGAIHLSKGIIERDIEAKFPDKSTPLILYCGGGYRSALAADSLQKMGYVNVLSMEGGWREWREKSLPQTA